MNADLHNIGSAPTEPWKTDINQNDLDEYDLHALERDESEREQIERFMQVYEDDESTHE